MTAPVHILATVRKPELLDAALLVFRTLRTGFPTAPVCVWGNALPPSAAATVQAAAQAVGAGFCNLPAISHDAWIEQVFTRSNEPFWICDTDMVFFGEVQGSQFPVQGLFAGRHEPEFAEEWTGTRHMERLHTCLMWFQPVPLRCAIRAWMSRIPEPWGASAQFPLFRQHFIPLRRSLNGAVETLFYDSCAGLYHALGGTPFTPSQNAAFEHLHCGTYADAVDAPSLKNLREVHGAVYANPAAAAGLSTQQTKYYQSRQLETKL
jgi:hypothetical protein